MVKKSLFAGTFYENFSPIFFLKSVVFLGVLATLLLTVITTICTSQAFDKDSLKAIRTKLPFTPDEVKRLEAAAKESGIKEQELAKLANVVQKVKLSPEQLRKLEEAVTKDAPTQIDLKAFMNRLSKTRQGRAATDNGQVTGAPNSDSKAQYDWLYRPRQKSSNRDI